MPAAPRGLTWRSALIGGSLFFVGYVLAILWLA